MQSGFQLHVAGVSISNTRQLIVIHAERLLLRYPISNDVKLKFKKSASAKDLLKKNIKQRFMSASNKTIMRPEIDKLVDQGMLQYCKVSLNALA